ncbi:hypothetical protein [Nocardia sp. NPDC056000]|uniref:hypothetical protein n=1 Tax=Nocardia sp. NPDC056000 TaxID=3345674 RepID=UPI0035E04F55
MNTRRKELENLAALDAERDRLSTVNDVLSDMVGAACDATARKGYRDCAAEDAKQAHWKEFSGPVLAEYFAAGDAYREARWGSESAARTRAVIEQGFAHDPAMQELIAKARTDLAIRHSAAKPVERDRRRSR